VLWRYLLVLGVLIDGGAHEIQIFSENSFIVGTLSAGASCNKEQRDYDRGAQSWNYFHWLSSVLIKECEFALSSDQRMRVRAGFAAII
jgi:hypothetical protein